MAASLYPFTAFNFEVQIEITLLGIAKLCSGQFSECDGLEMTMDVKTIREGGNNVSQIRLLGGVNYGQVTLKRGMTPDSLDLWNWFDQQQHAPAARLRNDCRGKATIALRTPDGKEDRLHYVLEKCLLTKLKAPGMNAVSGVIAVEEMQLTYERMQIVPAGGLDA
ncbi:MAG TPA: phage tail protein [Thermoanaerobaculia bacterium]|jgi:phage tail-like protein